MVPDRDLRDDRTRGRGESWRRPRVHEDRAVELAREALDRREGFTPSWTSTHHDDAGRVLLELFAEQVAATARCVNDLTLKARVDILATAGIGPLPPRPLRTLLTFEVSPSAPRTVVIGQDFRVLGRDVDGRNVSFETEDTFVASPGQIAAVAVETEGSIANAEVPHLAERITLLPFGRDTKPDSSLYIGLDTPISPSPQLSLGWFVASDSESRPPLPGLLWELLDGPEVISAEVLRDETSALTRTGTVALRTPVNWRPTTIPNGPPQPLRWIRVRIVQGRYASAPIASHLALNAMWARSGETVRREVLTPIAAPGERTRRFQLARTPILAENGRTTLQLVVDEGEARPRPWVEEPDLSMWRSESRVYQLDPTTGVVEFGDGVRGRQVPDGFRHVQAQRYRVHVPAGRVIADAITSPVGTAPFVVGVTNPMPATGAIGAETLAATLQRGPKELAARRRAVTAADYEVLALHAPGADVRRVLAEPGFLPSATGRRVPGVVGLLVVSADRQDGAPPIPEEQTLRAVEKYLMEVAAPAGVAVHAAAPRYVRVGVDLSVIPASTALDPGELIDHLIQEIDRYLHPLIGGESETGWAFGESIRPVALVRRLLERPDLVRAISRIAISTDGVRHTDCDAITIPRRALLWRDTHRVIPVREEDVT
jgi:hypothetical protein